MQVHTLLEGLDRQRGAQLEYLGALLGLGHHRVAVGDHPLDEPDPVRFLRREVHSRLADIVQGRKEHHLLLDGKHVYLESDSRQIVDLMRNTNQPMLLICLTDTVSRLNVDVDEVLAKGSRIPVVQHRSKRRALEEARTA